MAKAMVTRRLLVLVLGAAALVLVLGSRADASEAPRAPDLRAGDRHVSVRWSFPDSGRIRVWRDGQVVHAGPSSPDEWVDRAVVNGRRYVYRVDHLLARRRTPRSEAASATPAPPYYRDTGPGLTEAADWAALDPEGPTPPIARYPSRLFRGDRLLTRGELAAMLFRLFGRPDGYGRGLVFADVPPSLRPAVEWVTDGPYDWSLRPLPGFADDTFRPGRPVTRGQLGRALYVASGTPATLGEDPATEALSTLDRAEQLLARHGVMTGISSRPTAMMSRGQVVRVLHRYDHWRAARRADDLPAGAWRPPQGIVPHAGSHWYVDATAPGETGQQAGEYLFTPSNSRSWYVEDDTTQSWRFRAHVHGDDGFTVTLVGPPGQSDPAPGLVIDGGSTPFPAVQLEGLGQECRQDGWFDVLEREVDVDGTVLAWTVRFGSRCVDGTPVRGELRYDADDPNLPPPPAPIPDDLWRPALDSVPADGTVVHLESSPGEWIVQRNVTLTPSSSNLRIEARRSGPWLGAGVAVSTSTPSQWSGTFGGTWTMDELEPGFYPNTNRTPTRNPSEGGVEWSGELRGCDAGDGWLAVDEISYLADGTLDHLVLRFEQRCGSRFTGFEPPLRGYVRYDRPVPAP
jgi:hypothetical protein